MIYEIDTSKPVTLNWNAKGNERVVQNIRNLISTWRYEVGYDRTKGIDPKILARPSTEIKALYISEIYRIIETYEPSAIIKKVVPLSLTEDGNLYFKVVIEI